MESPLKKKKLNQSPCEDYFDDQPVKIIVSDNLLETKQFTQLKKQLGGRKIKQIQAKFTPYNHKQPLNFDFLEKNSKITKLSNHENLLFISTNNNSIHVFDLLRNELQQTFENTPPSSTIDGKLEFYYRKHNTTLQKGSTIDFSTIIWKRDISSSLDYCYCEEKKEIYLFKRATGMRGVYEIEVLDCKDGSLKRKINIQVYIYGHVKAVVQHDGKDTFYIVLTTFVDDSDDDSSDSDPDVDRCRCFVYNDNSSNLTKIIECTDEDEICLIAPSFSQYLSFLTNSGTIYTYDKETFELLCWFPTNIDFASSEIHFESNTNTLITHTDDTLKIEKLELLTNIIDMPFNKEICQNIDKLGCKLPTIIPKKTHQGYEIPDSLQFLMRIPFDNVKLWYIDSDVVKSFTFRESKNLSMDKEMERLLDDTFIIGGCYTYRSLYNQVFGLSIHVKKSEISNSPTDFPVYIYYNRRESMEIDIKTVPFSEFISKLRPAEFVSDPTCLVDFPYIYSELLKKGIIDSETRLINQSLLFESYQKVVTGLKMFSNSVGRYFGLSTIRFDNFDYKKIDLILMADHCDSNHCFTLF